MSNPMDILEVARDLVRREECERLFDLIHAEDKEVSSDIDGGYNDGYKHGLSFAMDRLDERIGHLRDKWADAGVL